MRRRERTFLFMHSKMKFGVTISKSLSNHTLIKSNIVNDKKYVSQRKKYLKEIENN